jgi:hypothetical protein
MKRSALLIKLISIIVSPYLFAAAYAEATAAKAICLAPPGGMVAWTEDFVAMLRLGHFKEAASYITNPVVLNDTLLAGQCADEMIRFSDDEEKKPCCINHELTKTISAVCEQEPRLMEIFADRIGLFITDSETSDGNKNALAEIIMRLKWLSATNQRFPSFPKLLSGKIGDKELLEGLKKCFSINRERVPEQFGTPLTGEDYIISGAIQLYLRGYDKNYYYLEYENKLIGIVHMFQITAHNKMDMYVHIYDEEFIRRGIGITVMRWSALKAGEGCFLQLQYPAGRAQIGHLFRCEKQGFLKNVEALNSSEDRATGITEKDSAWRRVSTVEEAEAMRVPSRNLFVRGTVCAENLKSAFEIGINKAAHQSDGSL